MIEVTDIDVYYGDIQVTWDVSLEIREDDAIVALIGPNGAGKTTILKAMSKLLPVRDGEITMMGEPIATLSPADIVDLGFIQVPEERNLFPQMTVRENLVAGAYPERARRRREETIEEVMDIFPVLQEKLDDTAHHLSGGQQQMLAVGRGLMSKPAVLALDEPSTGLAPKITQRLFETIDTLSDELTIFLIEQHIYHALDLADRAYILENGQIIAEGRGDELRERDDLKRAYL